MPQWFLSTISYQELIDDAHVGIRSQEFIKQKTVSESYLIDATCYTDAEARLYEIVAANTPDFTHTISRMKLADVFTHDDGDTWYKVKALFITDDERTGKQKKTPSVMLVNAHTPKEAYERIEQSLKSALDPFEITDVNSTKILEIYPYDGDRVPNPAQDMQDLASALNATITVSNAGLTESRSFISKTDNEASEDEESVE